MGCVQLVEMAKERTNGKKAEIQRPTYGKNLSTSVSAAQSTALGMPINESPIPRTAYKRDGRVGQIHYNGIRSSPSGSVDSGSA